MKVNSRQPLYIYNSLVREKEIFEPIQPPLVGLYVCGPTVYNEVHLGNCRTFISFDIIYRYLSHLGYKVRYVRNITDVGHLQGDVDTGADNKIEARARLEQLEPMEIVQKYTNSFHKVMHELNTLNPSIEPSATGHIIEQIEMVQQILDNGYAYERNGSVYFNTHKFIQDYPDAYGKLSGKIMEDLLNESRDDLKHQGEKDHPADFAIWVKAEPTHIMRWSSPWSDGFPGWHLECSVMSTKYLGDKFDIHGGGMDLQFPHHENEIAQNVGACGHAPVKYWLHGNMLLLNGKKMSKSDGNYVLPAELFSGNNNILSKAYSPMIVRFFMLQAHYRSTLNITDEGLQAAEEGYKRLMEAYEKLVTLEYVGKETVTKLETEVLGLLDDLDGGLSEEGILNWIKAVNRLAGILPKTKNTQLTAQTVVGLKAVFAAESAPQIADFQQWLTQQGTISEMQQKKLGGMLKGAAKKWEVLHKFATTLEPHAFAETDDLYLENYIQTELNLAFEAMNDDFHTPKAISHLFGLVKKINTFAADATALKQISKKQLELLKTSMQALLFNVFGLKDELKSNSNDSGMLDQVLDVVIDLRQEARANKDFALSDQIRERLQAIGIQLKDGKEAVTWSKI